MGPETLLPYLLKSQQTGNTGSDKRPFARMSFLSEIIWKFTPNIPDEYNKNSNNNVDVFANREFC